MDFELGEEQIMLKTSARDFLDKECPKKLVRDMMDDDKGYSPELWQKMAELGWQGLAFPEEYGGIGTSYLDLVVLLEEMGRALVPGPFMATVVHAGMTILAAGSEEQKSEYLGKITEGELIMTLALTEANGSYEAEDIQVKATASGDNFVINGTKLFIPDANVADYVICVARTKEGTGEDGISLFIVDTKAAGVNIEVLKTMTGEKLCEITFNNVSVPAANMLGNLNDGWTAIKAVLEQATVAECAWMAGGARWILETTLDYTKERIQFGKPIGSFQAIQHKFADLAVEIEGATSLVYYAAWAIMENDTEKAIATSMAKAWCSDIYKHAAFEGVQIHGGIGFTWDHDMHLYFKRAKSSEVAFGDANYHREKIAQILNM